MGVGRAQGSLLETDKIANGYLKKSKQKRVLFPTRGRGGSGRIVVCFKSVGQQNVGRIWK